MGLTAGPVPPRVDAPVKAGLLKLVAHAQAEGGWSLRKVAHTLGLEHVRGSDRESGRRFSGNGDVAFMPSDSVLANVDVTAGHGPQLLGLLVLAIPPVTKLLVQVERPQRSKDERPGSVASIGHNRPRGRARCRQHSRTSIMLGAVDFREQVTSKFTDIATCGCCAGSTGPPRTRLVDARPGPEVPLHALLDWERAAIVKVAEERGEVDRSHRKLAHRGSRLELVYVSESTVLRVLIAEGVHLPERPARERRDKRPFPEWAELVPGVIFIYDFTHFAGLRGWCAIAVIDVVSRKWLATVVSAEESSTQVEIAFTIRATRSRPRVSVR